MKRFLLKSLGIVLIVATTSCMPSKLQVQTHYLSRDSLASFQVGTPDPRLAHPWIGERLIIKWSIPSAENLHLRLFLIFRNHTEKQVDFAIKPSKKRYSNDTFVYDLLNANYNESQGILAYRVEILSNEAIIQSWNHPLWVPIIQLNQ